MRQCMVWDENEIRNYLVICFCLRARQILVVVMVLAVEPNLYFNYICVSKLHGKETSMLIDLNVYLADLLWLYI